VNNERFSRQSFLGEHSRAAIERATIGVVGLGGGGGHIAQQLAHIGFLKYRLFDGDFADESNLNRLVTATEADVLAQALKVERARCAVRST
jgi:molybdopterin-synthase adenylyltransferase